MKATKQFIEDAIEGGWSLEDFVRSRGFAPYAVKVNAKYITTLSGSSSTQRIPLELVLLDPLAWQAVGKTRGWNKYIPAVNEPSRLYKDIWHTFIDHLADGKTIEEALEAISK